MKRSGARCAHIVDDLHLLEDGLTCMKYGDSIFAMGSAPGFSGRAYRILHDIPQRRVLPPACAECGPEGAPRVPLGVPSTHHRYPPKRQLISSCELTFAFEANEICSRFAGCRGEWIVSGEHNSHAHRGEPRPQTPGRHLASADITTYVRIIPFSRFHTDTCTGASTGAHPIADS